MLISKRKFIAAAGGFGALALALPARSAASTLNGIELAAMRGSMDATELGVGPGGRDQSRAFANMLRQAADRDMPVFLPAGNYVVSNHVLPEKVRLTGVPGATRIVFGGEGSLMRADGAAHIELAGLVVDGGNRRIGESARGLLDFRRVANLTVDNCGIVDSSKYGLFLEEVAGRVERSSITGARDAGLYCLGSKGLSVVSNSVADCGNGGILVHRRQPGEDGTIVTGNRIERIRADSGGTGQFGNGINLYRADGVFVSGNVLSDCAFSAIRANASSNMQITGNTCLRSGETALYAEFAFEGAIVSGNIVDGAANGISIVTFAKGGRLAV